MIYRKNANGILVLLIGNYRALQCLIVTRIEMIYYFVGLVSLLDNELCYVDEKEQKLLIVSFNIF